MNRLSPFGIGLLLLTATLGYGQKKPLDHGVYDRWETVANKQFTNDGKAIAYQIAQQEGDKTLRIHFLQQKKEEAFPRGEQVAFTADSKFMVFAIRPTYSDLKAVKNKKKKEDEIAKDSLAIYNLTQQTIVKIPQVKSFKLPVKGSGVLAYLLEKEQDTLGGKKKKADKKADKNEPLTLVVRHLETGSEERISHVVSYHFDEIGNYLVYVTANPEAKKKEENKEKTQEENKDTLEEIAIAPIVNQEYGAYALNLKTGKKSVLLLGEGKFSQFNLDKEGKQVVFTYTQDDEKALVKNYAIYQAILPKPAQVLIENTGKGMPEKWVVSENYTPQFSKNGKRLYFGIAPQTIPKDTTLIADDHAIVDIWHYKEDYLQPQQLVNLDKDLKKSYLATVDLVKRSALVALADETTNYTSLVDEGDATLVFQASDYGRRVEKQWDISGVSSYYLVNVQTGKRTEVVKDLPGRATISPKGTAVVYYNSQEANWYVYDVKTSKTKQLNKGVTVSFAEEEFDMPDLPSAYGIKGWTDHDESVLIGDRYDIWEFYLKGNKAPRMITNGYGRQHNLTFDLLQLDDEKKSFNKKEKVIATVFDNQTKEAGYFQINLEKTENPTKIVVENYSGFASLTKAKNATIYALTKGNFTHSNDLYVGAQLNQMTQISQLNSQQQEYNWGTNELIHWTTPNGYDATGVLFKPEDFDASKKYPMIVYFYEKLSDNLNRYEAPAPTPSRLNIPYFVSNGYLVFTPDISYTDGFPGKAAEEYINSGVDFLKKNAWVDGDKIGIQGQSWGGYQVTYLVTVTDRYAAAWAGAPVANMTSAYGGIRWGTGMSRQFQYEKTQSRIGKTLWEGYDLYIENSPLFKVPNITTPLVIMHNDNDGAVPWYQGIEMFMAMRRLEKPVWMLNYNGDEHNLMKRQNRKDIQIRQQQFFDYYLKDAKAPVWMVKGVPAVLKGKDWGFELTEERIK
ncbi:prolyl oligopeptidase family serine peptidase [Myroides sp. 1354]|uniref:alpha/beta hydrolase family protein n=1 Tax=unclassified Myroides TaxID=2642485 RepID=UPI002578F671|nr:MULTISPECIES: prolyl oligopeptidase family serine peptidase [unclassified Myroides]MDM1045823.1 prolyl oligopeptidase family serine peptidase [Myroides sp. R163-1]MDM1055722.1 prolyl oligopeptidase family serine peptidase [Myroides sp. 1354]MDM1069814.1 prolyl oligopeptidase family serine peptidase [Myroides sp. 1372]